MLTRAGKLVLTGRVNEQLIRFIAKKVKTHEEYSLLAVQSMVATNDRARKIRHIHGENCDLNSGGVDK